MTRVKRGVMTKKRHDNILEQVKGFRMMNGNVLSRAKNALAKSGLNAYIGRKDKKRDFRALWNIRINNAVREYGMNYSNFIHALYLKRVKIDRKALSNLAIESPEAFRKIVEFVR